MSKLADALKKFAVALGFGSDVTEYSGNDIEDLLFQMAVKMECAQPIENARARGIAGLLNYIADNYGDEEKEPYDLTKNESHATVTFERNGIIISAGKDLLHNGDKIKITAAGATGYDVTRLTVNNTAFVSGNEYTVNGHNVVVVVEGTLKTFNLARTAEHCTVTVTKGGSAVSDGTGVLTYGDTVTITASAADGYTMSSLKVNGQDFTSGSTATVTGNIAITAAAIES